MIVKIDPEVQITHKESNLVLLEVIDLSLVLIRECRD